MDKTTTIMREVVKLLSDSNILKVILQGVDDRTLKDIILLGLAEQRTRCTPIKIVPGGMLFAPGLTMRK